MPLQFTVIVELLLVASLMVSVDCDCAINCKDCYRAGPNKCDVGLCETGYFVNKQTICGSCSTNCVACSDGKTCTECAEGYYVDNGQCKSCLTSCARCDSATACSSCSSGYGLNAAGDRCTQCANYCAKCEESSSGTNQCTECEIGHPLINGDCTQSCSSTDCTCKTPGSCEGCDKKYFASATCTDCADTNCADCSSATAADKCQVDGCIDGYTYSATNQRCLKCSVGCKPGECSVDGKCRAGMCGTGYKFNSATNECESCAQCDKCHGLCSFGKCTLKGQCNPGGCVPGAGLKSTKCVPCPVNCLRCDKEPGERCDVDGCSGGFGRESNGLCAPCGTKNCKTCGTTGECTKCNEGFYLNPTSKACVKCPTGCKSCTSDTVCTACLGGFLKQGVSCIKCPEGCHSCTSNTVCDNCKNGYRQEGTSCQKCSVENCAACASSASQCERCRSGYRSASTVQMCTEKCTVAKCSGCADDKDSCTYCDSGYYLDDAGQCKPCLPGCGACRLGTECNKYVKCNDGYYYDFPSKKCMPVSCYGSSDCASKNCYSLDCAPSICPPANLEYDKSSKKCTTPRATRPKQNPGSTTPTTKSNQNPGGSGGTPPENAPSDSHRLVFDALNGFILLCLVLALIY